MIFLGSTTASLVRQHCDQTEAELSNQVPPVAGGDGEEVLIVVDEDFLLDEKDSSDE